MVIEVMNTKFEQKIYYFFALAMPLVYFLSQSFDIQNSSSTLFDYFFGADCWRVLENLRDGNLSTHFRDRIHPFFSLFAVSISKIGNLSNIEGGAFLVYRTFFGVLGVFLFQEVIFRQTKSALIAFSATLLLLSTFTVKVWSILPETHLFGFFTIMLSFYLIDLSSRPLLVFISSISGAITNCFIGLMYLAKRFTLSREYAKELIFVICSIALITNFQKIIYPTSTSFFEITGLGIEKSFIIKSVSLIPFRAFDFFYSGFIIPLSNLHPDTVDSHIFWSAYFSDQFNSGANIFHIGISIVLILVPIIALISLVYFLKNKRKTELNSIVFCFILFQFFLHMIYGDNPFLYSFHFLPVFILFITLNLPRGMPAGFFLILFSYLLRYLDALQAENFLAIFG